MHVQCDRDAGVVQVMGGWSRNELSEAGDVRDACHRTEPNDAYRAYHWPLRAGESGCVMRCPLLPIAFAYLRSVVYLCFWGNGECGFVCSFA